MLILKSEMVLVLSRNGTKIFQHFFSDTTWFYGLHDFTVTHLRYINYYTIQYYTNSIQCNTIPTLHTPYNIFTLIIYIVILPMTCQCRSRNCFASIRRKIVTHLGPLSILCDSPLRFFVPYMSDLLIRY